MEGSVAESRMPLDAVTESLNFDFDRIGAAQLRKGTTLLGNQLSGDILGLYEFRDSGSGSNNQLLTVNGTTAYYLSGGTWTSKRTGLTSGSEADFTTFLDVAWMVNGTEDTAVWNGDPSSSFSTSGNATNAPTGKYIENFRSRVWIAGNSTYPDRLYFSSLPSATATPTVSWDTSVTTGDWIDIAPQDGENIKGIKRSQATLLVFKNNHIYPVYSTTQTEPDPKINVGTYSKQSIVEAKDGLYFHHPSGFYKLTGGTAQEISKPIQDIVDSITVANYSKVNGWQDGDHVYWAVGDVTIDGTSFSKVVVRYTISTQVWTHRSYPQQFLVSSNYNDGTNLFQLVGDDDGNILKVNIGKTDNGTPINYSLIHRWYTLDGLYATQKTVSKLMFVHNGGTGTNINYQTEDSILNEWTGKVGQLKPKNTSFDSLFIKGRKCRFRLSGASVGEPFTYHGFEVYGGITDLVKQP